jgi:2-keto-4-pentenoate hydratase/2-oxohepta-3-ene-1,7-dioic acid hydratase in catechol pathway
MRRKCASMSLPCASCAPLQHLVAYDSPQSYSVGDLITTGTISRVAAFQSNPFDFYLQPGDVVEAYVEGSARSGTRWHLVRRSSARVVR